MSKKIKILNIVYPIISMTVIVLIWAIAAYAVNLDIIVPSVKATFLSLFELFKNKSFYIAVGNTLLRTLISFLISLIVALVFAVLSSIYKTIEKILLPIIIICRAIPTISIILLVIVWMNSNFSPMLISIVIIFPIIYTSILDAIKGVDSKLVVMANNYNVKRIKTVKYLYIPEVLPAFFTSIKTTLSFNLKLIIASEVLAQTSKSMGINMQFSKLYLETPQLFAWTIVAILLGALFELLVYLIEKAVIRRPHANKQFEC